MLNDHRPHLDPALDRLLGQRPRGAAAKSERLRNQERLCQLRPGCSRTVALGEPFSKRRVEILWGCCLVTLHGPAVQPAFLHR
jgi:hypothetical protein